jgi:hypothetical protein
LGFKSENDSNIANLSIRETHINGSIANPAVDFLQDLQCERTNMSDLTGRRDIIITVIAYFALDKVLRLLFLSDFRNETEALLELGKKLAYSNAPNISD